MRTTARAAAVAAATAIAFGTVAAPAYATDGAQTDGCVRDYLDNRPGYSIDPAEITDSTVRVNPDGSITISPVYVVGFATTAATNESGQALALVECIY